MRKITSVFAALSFLVVLPTIGLPTDTSALPMVQPNTVAGVYLPIEKSAYVHRGRRYCFYRNGWRGPGYYLCRRPYLRGFYLAPRFFRQGLRHNGLRHDRRFRSGIVRSNGGLSRPARYGRTFGRYGGYGQGVVVNRSLRTHFGRDVGFGPGRAPVGVTRSSVRQGFGGTPRLNGPAAVNRGGAFTARPGNIGRVGGGGARIGSGSMGGRGGGLGGGLGGGRGGMGGIH